MVRALALVCGAAIAVPPVSLRAQGADGDDRGGFIETFDDAGFRDRWFISEYDRRSENFLTSWRRSAVSLDIPGAPTPTGGALVLKLEPSVWGSPKPFVGAELQRPGQRGYGSYEVVMQPGRGNGLVSAMFTYTGPHFKDPHDEIDLEFLGRDTTRIWINRFADGERMPGEWPRLGFDAANGPRLYRFDWTEDAITWFADGQEVQRITSDTHAIPNTPGKIFLNIWVGNEKQRDWLGRTPPQLSAEARFYCVSYRPPGDEGETCSDYINRNSDR
ncbi:MAG: family 16 glycosylhydrolase [Marinibacterium sp.]|nr:family 16 glycosylhydrolase [Marinibacterium sp.]